MTEDNKRIFLHYAKLTAPKEACGLLLIENGQETVFFCKNISEVDHQFIIDPMEQIRAEHRGDIIAVVHSHPFGSCLPSEADLVGCEQTGLKWHIVGLKLEDWYSFEPSGYVAPLVGREWCHGLLDCYSLVRDYYKTILNIELPDYDRSFEWWINGENLFERNFMDAGFIEVHPKDIKKHDGILIKIKSPVINHAGIFQGVDKILHHCHKRLSSKDLYGGIWQKHTVRVVRHRSIA